MVDQCMTDLSNWGRWVDDDQLGTLNLITVEKRLQAIGLATVGTSVSLSHNYLKDRGQRVSRSQLADRRDLQPGNRD